MTSSLTTALEEMTINNEQLRRENDLLKIDNTQLRTNNDALKDELTTLLDEIAVNSENQRKQINSQSSESEKLEVKIGQLKEENQQPKPVVRDHTIYINYLNYPYISHTTVVSHLIQLLQCFY